MIRPINLNDDHENEQLIAVQQAAYRVEAALIQFDDIPPLFDTVETLRASHETFYGYFMEGELAGMIAYQYDGETLDIYRLAVNPAHFKQGIASALLRCIETVEPDVHRVIVSTGSLNTPARQLYARHDYLLLGEQLIADGVYISHYEKKLR
ncbi:MAG: GNAT family N-acetyltransferase [Anaerolineae bacterium]